MNAKEARKLADNCGTTVRAAFYKTHALQAIEVAAKNGAYREIVNWVWEKECEGVIAELNKLGYRTRYLNTIGCVRRIEIRWD